MPHECPLLLLLLQDKSAGALSARVVGHWAQGSHTAGEHFAFSRTVCSHHSSLSLTAVPCRLVWLSQRLTLQLFPLCKARMGLHREHFVQSWMFFHPHNLKKIQCKLEQGQRKAAKKDQRYRVVYTQGRAECPRILQPGKQKTWK